MKPEERDTWRMLIRSPEDAAQAMIAHFEAETGHRATEEDVEAARQEVRAMAVEQVMRRKVAP